MTTPAQLLDAAEQEFRHHRFTAGANLVWHATYQAIAAAAYCINLPCRNEQEAYYAATLLDQRPSDDPAHHWLKLSLADAFRTQAAHHGEDGDWHWEAEEYIESMAGIRLMVSQISQNGTTAEQ